MSIYFLLPMLVLLPLVPAFILFKVLKSSGEIRGPLYGLTLQLGGAFAGYFALLLVLLFSFKAYIVPPPVHVVWTVKGQVVDQEQKPLDVTTDSFALLPASPPPIAAEKGQFSVNFIPAPQDGGGVSYPTVIISYTDYLSKSVNLDPAQHGGSTSKQEVPIWDNVHHVITIPAIALMKADTNSNDVHTSDATPIQGVPEEYLKIGSVTQGAPPPGYAK
jgi:hypothetical protein